MNKFSLLFMNIPKISFDNIHGKILNDNATKIQTESIINTE